MHHRSVVSLWVSLQQQQHPVCTNNNAPGGRLSCKAYNTVLKTLLNPTTLLHAACVHADDAPGAADTATVQAKQAAGCKSALDLIASQVRWLSGHVDGIGFSHVCLSLGNTMVRMADTFCHPTPTCRTPSCPCIQFSNKS